MQHCYHLSEIEGKRYLLGPRYHRDEYFTRLKKERVNVTRKVLNMYNKIS